MTGALASQARVRAARRPASSAGRSRRFSLAMGIASTVAAALLAVSPAHAAWTSGMAKRLGRGPFGAAPIVQGDPNDTLTNDVLSVPRGTLILGNFYANLDPDQGSLALWWTPEYGSAALSGAVPHYLWYANASYFLAYEYNNDRYNLTLGGQTLTVNAALTAGTPYSLVARWDTQNTLNGTSYLSLSINDVHTFGVATPPVSAAPGAQIYIGTDGGAAAASGIVEGLTVYRRPLFDGAFGIDAGNGDEILQIYNAGAGEDPTVITGSWDVVFCLPTNASPGALVTGNVDSWSHPHAGDLIPGNSNRGGFMFAGTAATDGWSLEGAPTSVSALAAGERIYAGGYKTVSNAANQGIYQDITVAPGNDRVARAVVHSDGTCQPKLVLYDQTNGAEIGSLTGTTTATRAAPNVLVLTGEAPAGSTTLRVKLVNTAAAGTCFWHQVEVLANAVNNPSLERWQGTTPDIPVGWTNELIEAAQLPHETTIVHSGAAALRLNGGPDTDRADYSLNAGVSGDFYALGVFFYYGSGQAPFQAFGGPTFWFMQKSATTNFGWDGVNPGVWSHRKGIGRVRTPGDATFYVGQFNTAGDFTIDDFYAVALPRVTLTVTPTTQAQSVENTNEFRVDGRDVMLVPNVGVTTTSGTVTFNWRPRHSAAQGVAFAETAARDAYFMSLYGDANDFVNLYWDSAANVVMRYSMNGSSGSSNWGGAGGVIVAGTLYTVQVTYSGGGNMVFSVNGTPRITLTGIPAAFGTAPTNLYYGSDFAGANQGDATFSTFTTTEVTLQSFEASGFDGGVDLAWTTASELDNLGFHLYRSLSAAGPFERITSSLLPGLGSSPTGQSYAYRDVGLVNGVTCFYELEDVGTTGATRRHGPVSATPRASLPGDDDGGGDVPGRSRGTPYGDPSATSLRILEQDGAHLLLELTTGGFFALANGDGTVSLSIPSFELHSTPGEPAVPTRWAFVEAMAGRGVRITSVRATDTVSFSGLVPAPASAPTIEVTREGMVRPGNLRRSAAKSFWRGSSPRQMARVLGTAFQGETKKAQLELAPLRFHPASAQLTLARRLLVRVDFAGTLGSERSLGGSRGRKFAPHLRSAPAPVQLVVRDKGLYKVRVEDVFPGRALASSSLALSRKGQAVPFFLDDSSPSAGTTLYFLSDGASLNPESPDVVYELARQGGGLRMATASAAASGPPTSFYWNRLLREENKTYQSGLTDAPDLWLWQALVSPVTRAYPFSVDALAFTSAPAHLTVWLQGASDFEADPDHHVRLAVNGTPVGEASWDGKMPQVLELDLTPGLLAEGGNTLEIENVGDTSAASSMVLLDKFSLVYPRLTSAAAGILEGVVSESGTVEVAGLGPGTVVLDTTDATPRWLTDVVSGSGALRFRAETGHRYYAADPSALLSPQVRFPTTNDLRNALRQADYLLIAPRDFLSAAAPLLQLRQAQGLRTRAVAIEDVNDAFGFGEEGAAPLKAFLSFAYHSWKRPSPRYVLLLGDATYDPKDFLHTGTKNRIPPSIAKTSYLWTASDPAYAALNGDDLLPDLALGRLPAATVDEARLLVDKIVAFETASRDLSGPAVLVADNADGAGSFERNADEIASTLLAGHGVEKIYLSEKGAGTRAEIAHALDQGASLLSYVGHGSIAVWASENVWNNLDVNSLEPQPQQPILFTMNCLNGFFHFPPLNSLAEQFVKADGKGAIAAFSPSGLSLDEPAHVFHKALLQEIVSDRHERLGDAVLAAQSTYADSGAFPELLSIYHLFGDPALRIRGALAAPGPAR